MKKHAIKLTLVIGNKNYSSWSLRAWLFLHAMGVEFDEIRIPLDQPGYQAAIRKYSPSGCVPVLLDGEARVWEALAICEYVAQQQQLPAWPTDPLARAEALSVTHEMHAGFAALRNEFPMNCRASMTGFSPSAAAAADVQRISDIWSGSRQRHGRSGPYLFGAFGLADAMYAPVAFRCRTYGLALAPAAAAYADCLLEHPSVALWLAAARAETECIPEYDQLEPRNR
ncbi:MAG: glutathione S-transferase family protein [Gammaproteobacteria bacterium]